MNDTPLMSVNISKIMFLLQIHIFAYTIVIASQTLFLINMLQKLLITI